MADHNALITRPVGKQNREGLHLDRGGHPDEAGRTLNKYYNTDGSVDGLIDHAFDNRQSLIRLGVDLPGCEWRPWSAETDHWFHPCC